MSSSTIELVPCQSAITPEGVEHLILANPSDYQTLCGVIPGKRWKFEGKGITCLTCRVELRVRETNHRLNNYTAIEGVDVCECGNKSWIDDCCVTCQTEWRPEFRES